MQIRVPVVWRPSAKVQTTRDSNKPCRHRMEWLLLLLLLLLLLCVASSVIANVVEQIDPFGSRKQSIGGSDKRDYVHQIVELQ